MIMFKKKKFSNKVVAGVIVLNVIFTIAVLYLFLKTGNEPSTLIGAWFTFTTVELWSLSKITREKVKNDNTDDCTVSHSSTGGDSDYRGNPPY